MIETITAQASGSLTTGDQRPSPAAISSANGFRAVTFDRYADALEFFFGAAQHDAHVQAFHKRRKLASYAAWIEASDTALSRITSEMIARERARKEARHAPV